MWRAELNKAIRAKVPKFISQSPTTLQAGALSRRYKVKIPHSSERAREKQLAKQGVIEQGLRAYLNNEADQLVKAHGKYQNARKTFDPIALQYDREDRAQKHERTDMDPGEDHKGFQVRLYLKKEEDRGPEWMNAKAEYMVHRRPVLDALARIKEIHRTLLAFQGADASVSQHATALVASKGVKAATNEFHEAQTVTTEALKCVLSFYHYCAECMITSIAKNRQLLNFVYDRPYYYKQDWYREKRGREAKKAALSRWRTARMFADRAYARYTIDLLPAARRKYRTYRLAEVRTGCLKKALNKHYWDENKGHYHLIVKDWKWIQRQEKSG